MKNEFENLLRLARLIRKVLDDEHYTLSRIAEICEVDVEQARNILRTLIAVEGEQARNMLRTLIEDEDEEKTP